MIRIIDMFLLVAAVVGAIYTFQIKHEAERAAKKIATLHAQIAAQDRKIDLLEADWALETRPSRLEDIASRYAEQLMLKPLESTQVIDISELPALRPEPEPEVDERQAGETDELTTGGIGALIEKALEN